MTQTTCPCSPGPRSDLTRHSADGLHDKVRKRQAGLPDSLSVVAGAGPLSRRRIAQAMQRSTARCCTCEHSSNRYRGSRCVIGGTDSARHGYVPANTPLHRSETEGPRPAGSIARRRPRVGHVRSWYMQSAQGSHTACVTNNEELCLYAGIASTHHMHHGTK